MSATGAIESKLVLITEDEAIARFGFDKNAASPRAAIDRFREFRTVKGITKYRGMLFNPVEIEKALGS